VSAAMPLSSHRKAIIKGVAVKTHPSILRVISQTLVCKRQWFTVEREKEKFSRLSHFLFSGHRRKIPANKPTTVLYYFKEVLFNKITVRVHGIQQSTINSLANCFPALLLIAIAGTWTDIPHAAFNYLQRIVELANVCAATIDIFSVD